MRIWIKLILVSGLILVCGAPAFASEPVRVESVKIEGNQRIEDDAILRVIETRPGGTYDKTVLSDDLEAIYNMGYFDDVQVSVEKAEGGTVVIFNVQEKATVREINISGNRVFDDEEVKENIDISTGSILNIYRIKRNIEAIKSMYRDKNYHNAEVTYKTEQLPHNQADLEFVIEEGKKVRIREIRLLGNKAYDDEALKDRMKTSEKGFFSWLTSSGDLDRETLEQDVLRLTAFYHNQGYAEARVTEPDVAFKGDWIDITIRIDEGARFKIGEVDTAGDMIETDRKLKEAIHIDEQAWYNQEVIRSDVLALTDLYADKGYARAEVFPQIRKREDENVIDIAYQIKKHQPIYFEEIVIEGNTKTRDKVIRRELNVYEQERYSSSDLKRSVRNLYRLDYFEDVNVKTLRGSADDKMVLKIDVEEKPTGTFSFGAGYSAIDKLYVMATVQERNFLGRGQDLQFKVQTGSESRQFSFSFVEPWLFDIPLSAGVSAYNWERDYDEYTRDSKGGELRFGYPVADYTRGYISYSYDVSDISDVDPLYEANNIVTAGTFVESSITGSLVYDSRDRAINPTEGSRHRLSIQYAGLGGDIGFTKITAEAGRYFPLLWGTVFFLHGEGGYADETKFLPDWEKFYLGGINSLRGFDWRDVSASGDPDDPVGGEKYVQFNLEFIFPIIKQAGLMGLVFYDTGNVYSKDESIDLGDLRESAGFGIRWYSPLGPIRLERGYVLDPKEGEDDGRWEFSIGGAF